ncbi:MAG: hypothetical protein ACSLEN_06680 [Candidatus Malihini olakiniferum]
MNRSVLARLHGGEFALLYPGMAEKEAQTLVIALSHNLESLYLTGELDSSPVAALGMVPFKHGDTLKSRLIQSDHALTRAESSLLHHALSEKKEPIHQQKPIATCGLTAWIRCLKRSACNCSSSPLPLCSTR